MQAANVPDRIPAVAGYLALAAFVAGTVLDALGFGSGASTPPSSLAAASHALIAIGILAGCAGVFAGVLRSRRDPSDAHRIRWPTALELGGIGLFLSALVLRGHRQIPPDPPLLAGQVVAVLACVLAMSFRRRPRHD